MPSWSKVSYFFFLTTHTADTAPAIPATASRIQRSMCVSSPVFGVSVTCVVGFSGTGVSVGFVSSFIQDMDAQYREKALSEIQNRLLDDNSSIHTDSPALSADSGKPALSLSSADQTWFELSSDCSDEEKEQMIKAAAFIKSCLRHSDK